MILKMFRLMEVIYPILNHDFVKRVYDKIVFKLFEKSLLIHFHFLIVFLC